MSSFSVQLQAQGSVWNKGERPIKQGANTPLPWRQVTLWERVRSGVKKENKSVCEKKTTYDIRNFPGASSIDRRVTHQPAPLLAEQRAPVSCCCCWSWWWWWWTSCGLTAWRCKYLAHKDDRTIKTETNKVVKFILSTWRFKGSLKKQI